MQTSIFYILGFSTLYTNITRFSFSLTCKTIVTFGVVVLFLDCTNKSKHLRLNVIFFLSTLILHQEEKLTGVGEQSSPSVAVMATS